MDTDTASSPDRSLGLVTGASHGIGRALAAHMVGEGWDLVVVAEDDAIQDVARELGVTADVSAVQADLATREGNEVVLSALEGLGRPVAAAAINAGVGVGGGSMIDTDLEDHFRLIDLNVTSTVHLGTRLATRMVEQGSGRLMFTSSVVSQAPGPFHATYAASKAFVHSFAMGLREELADTGVTVTALMPGPTDTQFFERAGMLDTKLGQADKDDPAIVASEGYEAMMAGRDHVVTGRLSNKLQAASGALVPDRFQTKLGRRLTEPQ